MKRGCIYIYIFLCSLLFSILSFSIWIVSQFGDIEIEKILFHLYIPLKDAPTDWMKSIWIPSLVSICFLCALVILKKYILKSSLLKLHYIIFGLLLGWTIFYIQSHFSVWDYIKNSYTSSNFIEKNYVDPRKVILSFPPKKKNLIFIQVESLESSVQDIENGGFFDTNYIPNLTKIAKTNVSFSHSDLIEGATVLPSTGWTIAGVVAETAGLPLKLYAQGKGVDLSMGKYTTFLPGAVSLGDILVENGYDNVFILGTSKKFHGLEDYLRQHGSYKIYDRKDIKGKGKNKSDKAVLEFSKNKLKQLSQNKKPFHVIIQTYDTHFGRYNSYSCTKKVFKESFQNGYICIDTLIQDFIDWAQKQEFYNDTVIVIIGDHCNMSNSVANGIEALNRSDSAWRHVGNTKRKVYNVFINSAIQPIQKNNRKFSTIDMFPTILASIGVKIEGNRLALGTNLFSNEKTLPEIYGYDYIFQELKKKSYFYNHKLLYGKSTK